MPTRSARLRERAHAMLIAAPTAAEPLASAPGARPRTCDRGDRARTGVRAQRWTADGRRCGWASTGTAAPRSTWPVSACAITPASIRPGATSSSAPTAVTPGPTAPPRCSPRAGSRRATAPRCRGCSPAAATAILCRTAANGTRFDLAGERISVSARAHAGPLVLDVMCAGTPAANLRALCRLTGFPMLLPEWGYGFWKSRDVHEHQDDVLDDYEGFRRNAIPLDAIVIDSPWATQYNTWTFNPHQFPDAAGMVARMRADGVRTVVWVTPWVNLDSRDGQIPPQPASERLHAQPAPNYAPAAAAGHFVTDTDGEPFVTKWWMGTGSVGGFHQPRRGGVVARVGQAGARARRRRDQGRRWRRLLHPRPRPARGRTAGGEAAWELGGAAPRAACSARSTRSIPARGCCSGAAAGAVSTRSATPGAVTRSRTSGRCACWWWRAVRRDDRRLELSPTTSAATSATGWSSAARRSC